jgi:hypothetical protein
MVFKILAVCHRQLVCQCIRNKDAALADKLPVARVMSSWKIE